MMHEKITVLIKLVMSVLLGREPRQIALSNTIETVMVPDIDCSHQMAAEMFKEVVRADVDKTLRGKSG